MKPVTLITGASAGIGAELARVFAKHGHELVLVARREDRLIALADEIAAAGRPRPLVLVFDLIEQGAVNELAAALDAAGAKPDILVNNAGGLIKTAPVAGLADEDWDYAVKWNLYSAFWASRKALGYMLPQKSGRIINISSVEGKHGKPAIPAYVTCKHALIGLTKAIAKETGTSGVTCNAICPGLVWTDVLVATGPDSAREMGLTFEQMVDQFAQETALKRISTVEEVAAVAVLLASDVAGGITGSAYNVDGGTAAY